MKNIRSVEKFRLANNLIFKLNLKVEEVERNDEMTRSSKSKAFNTY